MCEPLDSDGGDSCLGKEAAQQWEQEAVNILLAAIGRVQCNVR